MLLRQLRRFAFSLALARAGSKSAARMAMMAMTTSNSIKVKACRPPVEWRGRQLISPFINNALGRCCTPSCLFLQPEELRAADRDAHSIADPLHHHGRTDRLPAVRIVPGANGLQNVASRNVRGPAQLRTGAIQADVKRGVGRRGDARPVESDADFVEMAPRIAAGVAQSKAIPSCHVCPARSDR